MPSQAAKGARTAGREPDPGILVDRQIREAINGGWITIDPFDENALQPATYDLGVGEIAVVSTLSEPVDLRERSQVVIEPFASAMLQTEEILKLSKKIVGRVGARSNLLRHGIFVSTGPQIDPGFNGRLFVNLLNVTDRPFLIRHLSRFLSVEFHALAVEASKPYKGPHQGQVQFSDDQINAILSRGGASLKDIHRTLLDLQAPIKDAAVLGREIPELFDRQHATLVQTSSLLEGVKQLTGGRGAIIAPITTLVPEPYALRKDILAVVQGTDHGFTATFFDANISASGDTQEEAVANLRSLIVEIFEDLASESPERLGPEPSRQLSVLRTFLQEQS